MKTRVTLAAALTLLAAALPFSASAEPVKLRIDWSTIPGHLAPLMPTLSKHAPDVFRHYGKSYVVEPTRLQGGGASLTAFAADQIDIGAIVNPPMLVNAVVEAKLDVKVIGQALTTELPGYLLTHFWVRKSEVKSLGDLRGKVVAITARGSNVEAAANIVLGKAGMQAPRDFQFAEVRFGAMVPALEARRIDAAPLVPPFNRMAARNPELAPLFSVGDAFGPVETLVLMVKTNFVEKHRAALVDFLEDNIRMRRWMLDPKTRPIAIKQISELTKLPESEYIEWVYTKDDYYYHPQALVNVERLQTNINTMKDVGIISAVIDARSVVDMSLAQEAAARIKD